MPEQSNKAGALKFDKLRGFYEGQVFVYDLWKVRVVGLRLSLAIVRFVKSHQSFRVSFTFRAEVSSGGLLDRG